MTRSTAPLMLAVALAAAGCATLEPPLPEVKPDVPVSWPMPERSSGASKTPETEFGVRPQPRNSGSDPEIGWRDFFADEGLEETIARALENNRDLRVAVLNVERARALYRVQRADRLPSVGGQVQLQRTASDGGEDSDLYTAGVGVTGFELDLFGRVRSLSEAALREYLATEEARRAAQLALVAEVANAWLTLAADRELLEVSKATLATQEDSFRLTQRRHELGAVSRVDLAQARTQVEQARSDVAAYEGRVAADTNALQLLVGAPLDAGKLPTGLTKPVAGLAAVPAGMPSEVLLRRPDVRSAEERLRAANANIGAARAAFFPSISLTGSVGSASTQLSGLFGSGSFAWTFMPRIDIPIFQAGRLTANLDASKAQRDITLAQYEKAIQAGFREVADALAASRTIARQREAQERLVEAAAQAEALSRARYDAGRDSYLALLVAQRTLYQAQQQLVVTRLAEQGNRVALYKALGGGWRERS